MLSKGYIFVILYFRRFSGCILCVKHLICLPFKEHVNEDNGMIYKYCNKFAGSISRWKFITLRVQYTTLGYSSQLF
jgi:hypothetical protein